MVALTRYFLWFFAIVLVCSFICGVLAAIMPTGMGAILTIIPYLIAMIWVLFKFLKQQRRAPTQTERQKFTLGFSAIYWLYNVCFLILGVVLATRSNPNAWQDLMLYLQNTQFLLITFIMFLLIAIPLYLLTYWFYGKQAERMAAKMFDA